MIAFISLLISPLTSSMMQLPNQACRGYQDIHIFCTNLTTNSILLSFPFASFSLLILSLVNLQCLFVNSFKSSLDKITWMSVNNEHFIPLSIITFPSISNIVTDSHKHIIIVWHIIMTDEVSTKIEILCKK